jgi:hypothetical protein
LGSSGAKEIAKLQRAAKQRIRRQKASDFRLKAVQRTFRSALLVGIFVETINE